MQQQGNMPLWQAIQIVKQVLDRLEVVPLKAAELGPVATALATLDFHAELTQRLEQSPESSGTEEQEDAPKEANSESDAESPTD